MSIGSSSALIDELAGRWRACGVEEGDVLLLHSSASRTLRQVRQRWPSAGPADLLESLLRALGGPRGTLLLPLFNFDFTRGVPFDPRRTPSQMGALSEAGRVHPAAVRTGHPIYGFAGIGAQAPRFGALRNRSGYGPDSPFGLLRELDGRIGILDLADQDSMTFYHHVEELLEVPYRFHKTFTAPVVQADGSQRPESFGIFVRDLARGVETHVDPMGELLWAQGLYRGERPGVGAGLRTIRARDLYSAVEEVIRTGRAEGLLFRYGEPVAESKDA